MLWTNKLKCKHFEIVLNERFLRQFKFKFFVLSAIYEFIHNVFVFFIEGELIYLQLFAIFL